MNTPILITSSKNNLDSLASMDKASFTNRKYVKIKFNHIYPMIMAKLYELENIFYAGILISAIGVCLPKLT